MNEKHDLKSDYFVMWKRVGSTTFGAHIQRWSTLSPEEQDTTRADLRAQVERTIEDERERLPKKIKDLQRQLANMCDATVQP